MDPARKPRCRMLDRRANRCQNEAVTDFGLCAHDLAAAVAEYAAVTAEAKARNAESRAVPPPRRVTARLAS